MNSTSLLGLFVYINIRCKLCKTLVDTGASLSLINKDVISDFHDNYSLALNVTGGDKIITLGRTDLLFCLGKRSYHHMLHVLKNCAPGVDCILRLDFISNNSVKVLGGSQH